MFSLAWRCSSLTQDFALSSDDCRLLAYTLSDEIRPSYRLCDIVYNNCTVRVPVVHGCQRLVSFLTSSIPDLKFDGRSIIEGDCLCEEGGADCGFSVVVELVFDESQD